jgi:hypothetical protein
VNVNVFFGLYLSIFIYLSIYLSISLSVCMYVWKWVEGAEHGGVGGPFDTVKIILTINEIIQAR